MTDIVKVEGHRHLDWDRDIVRDWVDKHPETNFSTSHPDEPEDVTKARTAFFYQMTD